MKHHGAFRRRTHKTLSKHYKTKGKVSIRKFLQEFKIGDKVILKVEPSYHKGMYYLRFHGKIGMVSSKRGDCYEVLIKDGRKDKLIVVHPIHLKRSE